MQEYDKKDIENDIIAACIKYDVDACWIDYCCLEEKGKPGFLDSFYGLGDIIRNAVMTLVLIGPGDYAPRSDSWLHWKKRLWTLPEILLSKSFVVKIGVGLFDNTDSISLCKMIYDWEDQDVESKLMYAFSGKYGDISNKNSWEIVIKALIALLWSDPPYEFFVDLELERICALMALLPHQIQPITTPSPEIAFGKLMKLNGLIFSYPSQLNGRSYMNKTLSALYIPPTFFYDPIQTLFPTSVTGRDQETRRWNMIIKELVFKYHFVAISYRQHQFKVDNFEKELRELCIHEYNLDAYWIDAYTMYSDGDPTGARFDLYHMADAYLRASRTLILLPSCTANYEFNSEKIWNEWGCSIWSLVETLLSSTIEYRIERRERGEISKRDVFINAYGENGRELKLVDIVEGSITPSLEETIAYLMDAIWSRSETMTGNLRVSVDYVEVGFPKFSAERVYALMAFMAVRIFPRIDETEDMALDRLLKVNGVDSASFRRWLRDWCTKNLPEGEEKHLSSFF